LPQNTVRRHLRLDQLSALELEDELAKFAALAQLRPCRALWCRQFKRLPQMKSPNRFAGEWLVKRFQNSNHMGPAAKNRVYGFMAQTEDSI
jgi:hypothetical protein